MTVFAALFIVDPIAIADVEPVLSAIPPDRALDKSRKFCGKARVEFSRVNSRRDQLENRGASAWLIAPDAVRVLGAKSLQDPGTMQVIMDQSVDGDQGGTDLEPPRLPSAGTQQKSRQDHCQYFVGQAVDIPQGADNGLAKRNYLLRGLDRTDVQLLIDPPNKIPFCDVTHKQEKIIRHLVQTPVSQRMAGEGAGIDMTGLRTRLRCFVVLAIVKSPIPFELRARR